jgi:hypothetical protein
VLKFLLVVLLVAVLIYVLTSRVMTANENRRRGGHPSQGLRFRRPSGPPPRQVAPDDDEDFLRWLERKRRKDSPEQ